jgi:hypothetical protein
MFLGLGTWCPRRTHGGLQLRATPFHCITERWCVRLIKNAASYLLLPKPFRRFAILPALVRRFDCASLTPFVRPVFDDFFVVTKLKIEDQYRAP